MDETVVIIKMARRHAIDVSGAIADAMDEWPVLGYQRDALRLLREAIDMQLRGEDMPNA